MTITPEEQLQRARAIQLLEAKWAKNVDTKQKALLLAEKRASKNDRTANISKQVQR